MVIILGNELDFCCRDTYRYLQQSNADVALVNPSLLPSIGLRLSLTSSSKGGSLATESGDTCFDETSGVLARTWIPIKEPHAPRHSDQMDLSEDPAQSLRDHAYVSSELHATWTGLLNAFECPVVNRPTPTTIVKPFFGSAEAIGRITEHGFKIPATLVTSNAATALQFYRRHGRQAFIAKMSELEPRTLITGDEGEKHLETVLARHAAYLHAIPDGRHVEVFIVGSKACCAARRADPSRNGGDDQPLRRVELAAITKGRWCALSRSLHLSFSQLSLIQTESGEFYCMNINEYPKYECCAPDLQAEITAALAGFLLNSRGDHSR